MAHYQPVLATRTPNSGTAPTFAELDEVVINDRLTWGVEVYGDGQVSFALKPDDQPQVVKDALVNIYENPCEIWLYRDDVVVQSGPVIGLQPQGAQNTINLVCRGSMYYMRYMFILTDQAFTATDQYTVAKWPINYWQGLTYGHYGLDTSSIGTSGQTIDQEWVATEAPNCLQSIDKIAQNVNGFEYTVLPGKTTKEVVFASRLGADKTSSIVLDPLNIQDTSMWLSVAFRDFASVGIATGADPDTTTPVLAVKENSTAISTWGRAGARISVDGADTQSTIDDYAQSLVDTISRLYLQFGGAGGGTEGTGTHIIPVQGAGVMDIEIGDTIQMRHDYGLGILNIPLDVAKKYVSVDNQGRETMSLVFF